MTQITVREGQSLYDIALQWYGDIEGYFWLLEDNRLTVESEIRAGQTLQIREDFISDNAVFFRDTNREINNTDTTPPGEVLPLEVHLIEVRNETEGSDGLIRVEVTGGVIPYGYLWSTGARTKNLSNVSAGTYTLTVEDKTGTTKTITVGIGSNNMADWLIDSKFGDFIMTSGGDRIRMRQQQF